MNILIVTAMFPPIQTGTSFYSKNLAAELTKNGHQVTVVSVRNIESTPDDYPFRVYRLPALHFPVKNYFKHLRFCSIFPHNFYMVAHIAQEHHADLVLLINHYLDIAFPAIYASLRNHIPLVISVGTQLQSLNPFRYKILRILDKIICGKLVFPFCKKIISWDKEIERYITELHSESIAAKSAIVPFGVNGAPDIYHRHHHDYSLHYQILGIGSVIYHRNFLFQIQVFKKLVTRYPSLRLKIIGHTYIDAPLLLAEELNIQDKITFTGELPHAEVLAELKKSDVHWMMLTSPYTGLGTSTLEAMLMGVPIVSNVPENLVGDSLLQDFGNYIYTDGLSIENMVEKLTKLLDDVQLRRKIGQNGKKFVQHHMNWDVVVQKMEEVLASVIEKESVHDR